MCFKSFDRKVISSQSEMPQKFNTLSKTQKPDFTLIFEFSNLSKTPQLIFSAKISIGRCISISRTFLAWFKKIRETSIFELFLHVELVGGIEKIFLVFDRNLVRNVLYIEIHWSDKDFGWKKLSTKEPASWVRGISHKITPRSFLRKFQKIKFFDFRPCSMGRSAVEPFKAIFESCRKWLFKPFAYFFIPFNVYTPNFIR